MDITSLQHPVVKHLVALREKRLVRNESGSVLIMGDTLIEELAPQFHFRNFLSLKSPPPQVRSDKFYIVTESILKKVTGLASPETMAAEIPLPKPANLSKCRWLLALDGISDPGNLGTLLRTALALGWEGAFLTPGSTDPFNDKALRAAKGATFKLPILQGSWEQLDQLITSRRLHVYAADLKGKAAEEVTFQQPTLLVLGNETHGIKKQLMKRATRVAIPMQGEIDSLNVAAAGAILLYLIKDVHGQR